MLTDLDFSNWSAMLSHGVTFLNWRKIYDFPYKETDTIGSTYLCVCGVLTNCTHIRIIWSRFDIVITKTEQIKCYKTNNFTMMKHIKTSRILIERTKEFYQKHCWQTLIHLYRYNKKFKWILVWLMKNKTKCITCGKQLVHTCYTDGGEIWQPP